MAKFIHFSKAQLYRIKYLKLKISRLRGIPLDALPTELSAILEEACYAAEELAAIYLAAIDPHCFLDSNALTEKKTHPPTNNN